MLRKQTIRLLALLMMVLPVAFTACIKDRCENLHTYTIYTPVYKTKAEVRANIQSNASRSISNPGKIFVLGQYIFLNEIDKGVHVIDNSDPSNPRNSSFIDIPGNIDIAVRGNALYADMYTDLVTIDISNPAAVAVKKITENVFPDRYYTNGFSGPSGDEQVIVEWKTRDTTVTESCAQQSWLMMENAFVATANSSGAASNPIGVGGSMARFTIINERLYTVGSTNLNVFNISSPFEPTHSNQQAIGWGIETIYPFKDKLFVGSVSGMFMFDVSNADAPAAAGQFQHVNSCDPVIADDDYAFVTLRSGTTCAGFTNELDIIKLNGMANPYLLKKYEFNNPHGLSKDGDLLFICDGTAGLKIYNSSNLLSLQLVKEISGIDAYDVITLNQKALVVAKDGLYQYNYANVSDIRLISKIGINE